MVRQFGSWGEAPRRERAFGVEIEMVARPPNQAQAVEFGELHTVPGGEAGREAERSVRLVRVACSERTIGFVRPRQVQDIPKPVFRSYNAVIGVEWT